MLGLLLLFGIILTALCQNLSTVKADDGVFNVADTENGRFIWFVDPKSIKNTPIRGSIEFLATKTDQLYYFPYAYDEVSGEFLGECKFNFGDGKWHRINFTLYGPDSKTGPLLHCQTDREDDEVKTWYYSSVKNISIRMDFVDPDWLSGMPSCLRNLKLQDNPVSICPPSSAPNLTTTALACGCSTPTKATASPIKSTNSGKTVKPATKPGKQKKYSYKFTKGKGKKVEWKINVNKLPVSGSFEYLPRTVPPGSYDTEARMVGVWDPKQKNYQFGFCSFWNHTKPTNSSKWLTVKWYLTRGYLNATNGNQGCSYGWTDLGGYKKYSIRFDSDKAPVNIRNAAFKIKQQKLKLEGCPPSVPIDNFTITGLRCNKYNKTPVPLITTTTTTKKPDGGFFSWKWPF